MQVLNAGDKARVIRGLAQSKSPNVGKIVTVVSAQGEHSRWGRMWRCNGEGICQMDDSGTFIPMGWADFPASWLVRIDWIASSSAGHAILSLADNVMIDDAIHTP